ncbi:lipid droplet-associated hydrolase [Chironomus tepperi]|uniref:lipid droplet-associated hydrolase n=1 Tax=Chironomus tepperi TaxID=113505 RepID=UPI00391F7D52
MHNGFVRINSVPTRVFTWGHFVTEKFNENIKVLVLVISGNPGLPGFYTTFCSTLYEQLNRQAVIWAVGHAGHDEPKKHMNMKVPKLKEHPHLYDLKGQTNHKLSLLEYIPPQIEKIHVVGHSVGSKIILDLLRESPEFNSKVDMCYLMFPTIEHIADSASGKWFVRLRPFFFILKLIVLLFNLLPHKLRYGMVKLYCRDMPEEFLEHCFEHTKLSVVEKILFMASDEMDKITELDEELVKQNIHKLKLYYGKKDNWVKRKYYHKIVERFPEIDAELCSRDFDHAFVLKSGEDCGEMVANWIKQR